MMKGLPISSWATIAFDRSGIGIDCWAIILKYCVWVFFFYVDRTVKKLFREIEFFMMNMAFIKPGNRVTSMSIYWNFLFYFPAIHSKMSVVGSLIFCTDCGNLLDSIIDKSSTLDCSQCGQRYPSKSRDQTKECAEGFFISGSQANVSTSFKTLRTWKWLQDRQKMHFLRHWSQRDRWSRRCWKTTKLAKVQL
jgi:hypothetical protein